MALETSIVCHTSVSLFSEQFCKLINFTNGNIYNAQAFSIKNGNIIVDIYDETDTYYVQVTVDEFFRNFMTIDYVKNSLEFYKLIAPIQFIDKFNDLLLIEKWKKKNIESQK